MKRLSTRTRVGIAAATVLAVLVVLGAWVGVGAGPGSVAPSPSGSSTSGSSTAPTPAASPSPTPSPTPTHRPPAGTLHVDDRYLTAYGARRVTWEQVLAGGTPLPRAGPSCTRAWRDSGKDARLDWSDSSHRCLDSLPGQGFKPQGVGGSATVLGYRIGGRPAAERNLLLTTWYSPRQQPGLVAPNREGWDTTRLVIMDLDRQRYHLVELVRPDGPDRFQAMNSHGSGVAWAGQYLYSSSLNSLWTFNVDDLMIIDGRLVLPAVSRHVTSGAGGLSSVSLDRISSPDRLVAVNYTRTGTTYVQTFDLDSAGRLAAAPRPADDPLRLTNLYGEPGRAWTSSSSTVVPGSNFQGVARTGPYTFVNSSALRIPGVVGKVDALVVQRDRKTINTFRLPAGNVESIYLDARRDRLWSVTENDRQLLFALPLKDTIRRAGR